MPPGDTIHAGPVPVPPAVEVVAQRGGAQYPEAVLLPEGIGLDDDAAHRSKAEIGKAETTKSKAEKLTC
jgi:hypothetical protein